MPPNVTSLIPGVSVSSLFVDKLSKNVGSATGTKRKPYLRLFITPHPARDIPLTNLVFSVRTVSYGPSFFPLIYGPSATRAGHKSTGNNEDP